ncbi:MAG: DPP IV N-terminal domain-containing protein [Phycisphaeraceae bacterium]|nr:DPP IV N-terminal domain-containing protein [Phycisphaeraceae bacterium]
MLAALTLLLASCSFPSRQPEAPPPALRTVAEQSGFRATATYGQVNEFLVRLAAASSLVRLSDIGASHEGRTIPLAIIADPPVSTPEEARRTEKVVVLAIGGIHSGECDGKEALLALARDIAMNKDTLLKDVILLIAPIYNPDGNEKVGPIAKVRPGQVGPDEAGQRANAQGYDLNRDFIKLDAPETRGLLKCINEWDPAIFIDTHTTNGSFHRYPMTYDGPKNPAADSKVIEFTRDTMLPAIAQAAKKGHNLDTFWYGNFADNHSRWETYPDQGRYGIQYVGLRNRLSILTESCSYATYQQRFDAQVAFVRSAFEFAASKRNEIRRLLEEADRRTVEAGRAAEDDVPIRSKMVAAPGKATVLGYVEEQHEGRTRPTEQHKDYEVDLFTRFMPEATVKRPYAYVIPAPASPDPNAIQPAASFPEWASQAIRVLQHHGVRLDELREDVDLDVATYTVTSLSRSRPFQSHELATVRVEVRTATRRVPAGSILVRTAQPLGTLAVYLLEPESADGLTTWNFFDPALAVDGEFPILRLNRASPLSLAPARSLIEPPGKPKPVTFDAVYESNQAPNFNGSPIGGVTWLDDGEHFLQSKDGRLHKVHAASGRAEPFLDPKPIAAALRQLPTINARTADSLANRAANGGMTMNKTRTAAVFEQGNDLYYVSLDGSKAARLTATPQREELVTFSPDGSMVAFVQNNDLWVVDVVTQTARALTTGGTDLLRNGKADWVYFEEVFGRSWQTYWWSPDSTRIAFLQIDSSPIRPFTMVNSVPSDPVVERQPYPKPGDPNPRARLFTVAVSGEEPREVDLADYSVEDRLILQAGWWPDSSVAYAMVSNRTQTWVDVLTVAPDGGSPKVLFRETTKAWVDTPPPPRFLKDGGFLFQSERSGWKHVYRYARNGTFRHAVTSGDWEARAIEEVDESGGWLHFSGTRDSHIAANLYRARLDGSTAANPDRLTQGPGTHRVDVSPNAAYFTDSWSSVQLPPRTVLRKVQDQSIVRWLDTNPVRDLDRFIRSPVEMLQIQPPDGFLLEASLMKPPDFDPTRKYPVWFFTYAGPQAPTVSDSWSGGRSGDHVLAQQGIIVFRADPRSASGKGAVSAWTAYKQLGVQEMADIDAMMKWLAEQPWVDAARIGMSGFSYGGFMTAYAMTHSRHFCAGIAGGSVTDWRDYDTIYTERYMLTPQENKQGYDKTSVVAAAGKLHGRLLIAHGMMDDNVHLQNATKLIRALQNAGKPFEMMLYPENRHGVGGRHWNRTQNEFITRTLGVPSTFTPPAPRDDGSPEPESPRRRSIRRGS